MIEERKKRTFIDSRGLTKSWTQKYAAQQIEARFGMKITSQHIGMIERGRRNPSAELLMMLAALYEIPVEELLNYIWR
ncbi:MAG: helix-turn-helix transcriptional regulator [Bacteroidota bacterium]